MDPKDIPGIAGIIIRNEIQDTCDYCGRDPEAHRKDKNPAGKTSVPLPIDNPFAMSVINVVFQRMGKEKFKPNPNNKAPFRVLSGNCLLRYGEERKKLFEEICVCDICGLKDGNRYEDFSWINPAGFTAETQNKIFKLLGKTGYPPVQPNPATLNTSIPVIVLCPDCSSKYDAAAAKAVKTNENDKSPD